ncbi:hypothetical protein D1BOALGB6SA_5511 [Olavius sp. associated proteobacterium Delta 1]|nr:hypothetical protein D1BOALGB6SA_5511 [Olavius sp. associated proteobacterium Delta 1]
MNFNKSLRTLYKLKNGNKGPCRATRIYKSLVYRIQIIIGILLISGTASGFFYDGNDLKEFCNSSNIDPICTGYVAAVYDTHQFYQELYNDVNCVIRPTKSTRLDQFSRVVSRFLRYNSEKLHWSGSTLVFKALTNDFPCSQSIDDTGRYFFFGEHLIDNCQMYGENSGFCLGYVAGVYDTQKAYQLLFSDFRRTVCLPTNATLGQLTEVFSKYLKLHPDYRNLAGSGLAMSAFYDAFPCVYDSEVPADKPSVSRVKPTKPPSEQVMKIQKLLRDAGYDPGPLDGYMGKKTRSAIKAFQKDIGLKPTGQINQELAFLLRGSATAKEEIPKSQRLAATGTGFFVTASGYAITNHHVIKDCERISARIDGLEREVILIASDETNDLALLRVSGDVNGFVKFRTQRRAELAEPILVAGYPLKGLLGSNLNVTDGSISALSGIGDDHRLLQITAPVQLGNSGGPLLDHSGKVCGVVMGKLDTAKVFKTTGDIPQNVNFAIKGVILRTFLDIHGIDYNVDISTNSKASKQIAKEAKKHTFSLDCWR